jgi:hypothetical protein
MPLARLAPLGLLVLLACSSTPKATARERAPRTPLFEPDWREGDTYGFSPENPIHVGGGPAGQHEFLDALRGPDGQPVAWRRLGSCCEFETPNGVMGYGLLDMYEVLYEGLERPVILYLDMYDAEAVYAPTGFLLSSEEGAPERPAEEPPSRPKVIEL